MTEEEVHQAAEKAPGLSPAIPTRPRRNRGEWEETRAIQHLLVGKAVHSAVMTTKGRHGITGSVDLYNLEWRKEGETQWQKRPTGF